MVMKKVYGREVVVSLALVYRNEWFFWQRYREKGFLLSHLFLSFSCDIHVERHAVLD
jgi:hypothetical protein